MITEYENINGDIIKIKPLNKIKLKRKKKNKNLIGKKVYYVGKTKDTGIRIVCYDGVILSQDNEIDPKIVEVRFIDNYFETRGKIIISKLDKKYLSFK